MARPRKRHVQQSFRYGDPRGGKRKGAGRPKRGARASERHKTRPELKAYEPVHVVLRVANDVKTLRRRDIYRAIRAAIVVTLVRSDFRIVHVSIQGTHIHLLVEADDKFALAEGMKAMQTSAARRINVAISQERRSRRTGSVFPDRYHAQIIRSPRQARNALAYVLNNWRKHREDRHEMLGRYPFDLYSTGTTFDGWADLDFSSMGLPAMYEPLRCAMPETWLLRGGWTLGGTISTMDVPSTTRREIVALAE